MKWNHGAIAVGWALVLVLGSAGAPAGPRTHVVTIEAMQFTPAVIHVRTGDTVVFRNADLVPHTCTEQTAKRFDSGTLQRGQEWKLVTGAPGTVHYHCLFHPAMEGTIVVEARESPTRHGSSDPCKLGPRPTSAAIFGRRL